MHIVRYVTILLLTCVSTRPGRFSISCYRNKRGRAVARELCSPSYSESTEANMHRRVALGAGRNKFIPEHIE